VQGGRNEQEHERQEAEQDRARDHRDGEDHMPAVGDAAVKADALAVFRRNAPVKSANEIEKVPALLVVLDAPRIATKHRQLPVLPETDFADAQRRAAAPRKGRVQADRVDFGELDLPGAALGGERDAFAVQRHAAGVERPVEAGIAVDEIDRIFGGKFRGLRGNLSSRSDYSKKIFLHSSQAFPFHAP
jgi:hypothetical protein